MDEAAGAHYVVLSPRFSRPERVERDRPLQVLLFLTALFAGFTGVFSGGRAVEPHEVGQAFAAASAIAEVAPDPASRAQTQAPVEAAPLVPTSVRAVSPAVPALLPALPPVDERRRE